MIEELSRDVLEPLVGAVAYSVVGIALMVLGYLVTDWLTPGKLGELIWTERNKNAAILLTSNVLGVGLIVVGAIWASEGGVLRGVVSTFVYGVIGLGAMAIAFLILDLLTPGKLGDTLTEEELHPAVWVNAAMHVALGGVIAMALS
ncbi:hypothetical protein GCM10009853_045230 [Glycomyces scopariae]|uniref:Uncharacterized membrane protein YjfL, UPF0719 family n=1 Tax=Glycomyces sambucus TaxID=380244 RepID=A0A1G9DK00_9ACTN|nr:DUF350 domain-containing protein [Glycomyces sambucus]SDK64217.1 Uncharacterized membrane protein YjfL, UPF0719 family [Glycomyces sambucus]